MNPAIIAHRMHNQRLSHSDFKKPVEVVKWLGALQGQDYYGAKWSIGVRLPGSTDAQIEKRIDDHAIVRTWAMRGTLHMVAADDVGWMVSLLAPRILSQTARRYQQLELDEKTLQHSDDLLAETLQRGIRLTRKELYTLLEENGISTMGQRGIHLLQHASLKGLLCQSIAESNNPTFFHVDGLGTASSMPHEEALAELAKRFFQSRGPATIKDFSRWAGLTLTDCRAGLAAIEPAMVSEEIDGSIYWRPDVPETADVPRVVMLPGFDEYILGYKDRSAVLDPAYETLIVPGMNGMFFPTIVIDGEVVGTWKRQMKKDTIKITLSPFEAFSKEDLKDIEQAAQQYGDFYEKSVDLQL